MRISKLALIGVLSIAASLTFATPTSAQRGRGHGVVVVPPRVIVPIAPPAPPVFVRPAPPWPEAVWTDGYYQYRGGHHFWVGGRWRRPRVGRHWAPHHWDAIDGGWVFTPGGWVID